MRGLRCLASVATVCVRSGGTPAPRNCWRCKLYFGFWFKIGRYLLKNIYCYIWYNAICRHQLCNRKMYIHHDSWMQHINNSTQISLTENLSQRVNSFSLMTKKWCMWIKETGKIRWGQKEDTMKPLKMSTYKIVSKYSPLKICLKLMWNIFNHLELSK